MSSAEKNKPMKKVRTNTRVSHINGCVIMTDVHLQTARHASEAGKLNSNKHGRSESSR